MQLPQNRKLVMTSELNGRISRRRRALGGLVLIIIINIIIIIITIYHHKHTKSHKNTNKHTRTHTHTIHQQSRRWTAKGSIVVRLGRSKKRRRRAPKLEILRDVQPPETIKGRMQRQPNKMQIQVMMILRMMVMMMVDEFLMTVFVKVQ